MNEVKHIEVKHWAKLIICHPELEASCPWEKLHSTAWHDILLEHPEFICHAPKIITQAFMTINQWLKVLVRHPELDEYFPASKTMLAKDSTAVGRLWGELLCRYPQFGKYSPWKHLRPEDWVAVLSQQPQFIGNYENDRPRRNACRQHTLSPSNIANVIACQPSLFKHFKATEFRSNDWQTILFSQPQLCDKCSFYRLQGRNLGAILARYPQWLSLCDSYSMEPENILLVADEFPEILNHYDLECFKRIGGGDTPWIERHPCLVPYTSWNFTYTYWDGLLTRLSTWMMTGKRQVVSSTGNGGTGVSDATVTKRGTSRADVPRNVYRRPLPQNREQITLRNSLDSIMELRYWAENIVDIEQVPVLPARIKNILLDETLTFEQLMLKMAMMSEEDCGMIFYGLFIQGRLEFLNRMFGDDREQTVRIVPMQYLLPLAIMYVPSVQLCLLFLPLMEEREIASFRDKDGNNALHYAFFRTPWHPEEQEDEIEAELFDNLQAYGVDPDAPNNMGFSYRQMRQGLETYLIGR